MENNSRTTKIIDRIHEMSKFCRTCSHQLRAHLVGLDCVDIILHPAEHPDWATYEKCSCREFIPLDNLDYVEWLVQKKNL